MKHIIKVEVLENLPETRPLIAMDDNKQLFWAGAKAKPVGPTDNEIWYWGEYYDIESAISVLEQQDMTYVGPAILSNKQVGDKYVITFDGPVTKLGKEDVENESTKKLYPIFKNTRGEDGEQIGPACNITRIEIPNSVTCIGDWAFNGCNSLTSIEIPNSVTRIGVAAFTSCVGLTSVMIPNSIISIGDAAFISCNSLTSIEIPNSVTSIGNSAFSSCNNLASVTIGNNVAIIGNNAFAGCSGLASVTIGNNVTIIGNSAFAGCGRLASIVIPDSVTRIESSAFAGCMGLTSITIGNGVTYIGGGNFVSSIGLTSITYTGTMDQYNSITKEFSWPGNISTSVVHCTDGDVNI